MARGGVGRNQYLNILLLFYTLYSMKCGLTSATVVMVGKNFSIFFEAIAANFAPEVKSPGVHGRLYAADPIDACSTLRNEVDSGVNSSSPVALIIRGGGCGFEQKVRIAQKGRFQAVVVYDNEDSGGLVAMAGDSTGIHIPAVFVSRASGERLRKYVGINTMELRILPNMENSAWSIVAVSFISLLALSAVLATCFFVRRHRIRRERPQPRVQEFHGMSSSLVKKLPALIFTAVLEDNCTAATCAICLEDYKAGDILRVLPCWHKFHAFCVDSWLTTWRTFCPVCKRDARTATGDSPASESTPLLSSSPASGASSPVASVGSSLGSSAAIQIAPHPHLTSQSHSLSVSHRIPGSQLTHHHNSASMSASRSSVDPRNMSSSRISLGSIRQVPNLFSPRSFGHPSLSPLNSRYITPSFPSPSSSSSGYRLASGRPPTPLHHSESAASFSPLASTHSLPG